MIQRMNVHQGEHYSHVGNANQSAKFIPEGLAIAQENLSVKFVFSSLRCPFDFQSPRKQEYVKIIPRTMTMMYYSPTSSQGMLKN